MGKKEKILFGVFMISSVVTLAGTIIIIVSSTLNPIFNDIISLLTIPTAVAVGYIGSYIIHEEEKR